MAIAYGDLNKVAYIFVYLFYLLQRRELRLEVFRYLAFVIRRDKQ